MRLTYLIISLMMALNMAGQNTKIVYVGDPMCSWCYGLTNELTAVLDHFDDQAEVEFVMGGLRPYYEVSMDKMKDFLSGHWEHVYEASGQEFSYEILNRTDLNYDTEPPCRAFVVYRQLGGNDVAKFFKDIQRAFYYNNKDMNEVNSYIPLLKDSGISADQFTQAFLSDEMKLRVKEDFIRAADLGVTSFPTILVEQNGTSSIVARGYSSAKNIIANINKVLK